MREQYVNREIHDIFALVGRKEQIEHAARAMKAISHPLRLKILCVLGEREVGDQDIVDAVETSQINSSEHLVILCEEKHFQFEKVCQPRLLFGERPAHAATYPHDARSVLRCSIERREVPVHNSKA